MSQPAPSGGWPDPAPRPSSYPQDPFAAAAPPPGASPAPPPGPYGAPGGPGGPPGYGSVPLPAQPPVGPPVYGQLPPPKQNGMAIAAMVVSIAAAVLMCLSYGVGGVVGVVGSLLGHVARRQIRERGDAGEGMALAGIIVGWIAFGLAMVAIVTIVLVIVLAVNAG